MFGPIGVNTLHLFPYTSKKRGEIPLFALLCCGFITAAVVLLSSCSKPVPAEEPLVTVQVAAAKRTIIEREVQAEAVLYAVNESAITPKISAPVARFLVQRGAQVHRGQLLAVLQNKDLAAAEVENKGLYEQAQAAYATAVKAGLPEAWQKAELDAKTAKESLDTARTIYESRQNLYTEGALPRKDRDQAEVGYVQARNQYDIAQKHLKLCRREGRSRS